MKTLYLIRGLSGSGKTSLAFSLCPKWNPFVRAIAADAYPNRYLLDGSLNPEISHQTAHSWVSHSVDGWMQNPFIKAIAIHNVFHKVAFLNSYLQLAEKHGWAVQVIHTEGVMADGEILEGVHGVPSEIQQRWVDEWEGFRDKLD